MECTRGIWLASAKRRGMWAWACGVAKRLIPGPHRVTGAEIRELGEQLERAQRPDLLDVYRYNRYNSLRRWVGRAEAHARAVERKGRQLAIE